MGILASGADGITPSALKRAPIHSLQEKESARGAVLRRASLPFASLAAKRRNSFTLLLPPVQVIAAPGCELLASTVPLALRGVRLAWSVWFIIWWC
jgi:hypothetical protein